MSDVGSGIEGFRDGSPFAQTIAHVLQQERFQLVDVGCAGGLAPGWRSFGDKLQALGLDGNEVEIERLSALEASPQVCYRAGLVGLPDDHPLRLKIGSKGFWHNWPSRRLQYERQLEMRRQKSIGESPLDVGAYFRDVVLGESWSTTPTHGFDLDYEAASRAYDYPVADSVPSGATLYLPGVMAEVGITDPDFIKIDVDGPDFEILRSLNDHLSKPELLGVALEVCFYGSHDANDNTFHNVDRLMREKGFDLFRLSVRTYGSAALPWPYLDAHPSMSTGGRVIQGDAIYIRDLASRARKRDAEAVSTEKLVKCAAIFSLFDLPDQASELLVVHKDRLSGIISVDDGLDVLAREIQKDKSSAEILCYRDYISLFELEDRSVFNVYESRSSWMAGLIKAANELEVVRRRLAQAEASYGHKLDLARMRYETASMELVEFRKQVEELRALSVGARARKLARRILRLLGPRR